MIAIKVSRCHRCLQIRSRECDGAHNTNARSKLEDQRYKESSGLKSRLIEIEGCLSDINSWLTLLSEDERYVIQRHLIDGIDIPRIAIEYRERWGDEYAKTERTIKSYQKKALQKIERFEQAKKDLMDLST